MCTRDVLPLRTMALAGIVVGTVTQLVAAAEPGVPVMASDATTAAAIPATTNRGRRTV